LSKTSVSKLIERLFIERQLSKASIRNRQFIEATDLNCRKAIWRRGHHVVLYRSCSHSSTLFVPSAKPVLFFFSRDWN